MSYQFLRRSLSYRSLRPRKAWTVKRTILMKLVRHYMNIVDKTGPFLSTPNHLAIAPGVDMDGVWIKPASELVTGELMTWMNVSSVSPITIPGYWLNKESSTIKVGAPPMPGEKVVYALHGGAYVHLSANPKDMTSAIVRGLLEHIDSVHRAFSIEYRLSSTKPYQVAHPFPTALLDALAGYNYLVNVVGFSPADIIVEGDSAGANLALALTRYLVEYKDSHDVSLPLPPGALVLLSPWSDIGVSHDTPESSHFSNLSSDYIGHSNYKAVNYAKDAFVGPYGMGAAGLNRYMSPASKHLGMAVNFTGFPRTFIVSGGAEVLLDQIRTLKDRMVKDLGKGNGVRENEGKVKYYEARDAIHDYLVFLWHEPERTETLKEIAKWVVAS